MVGSVNSSSSSCTTCVCPYWAAQCSGVSLSLFCGEKDEDRRGRGWWTERGITSVPVPERSKLNMTSKRQSSLMKPRKTLVGHKAVTLWHSFTMKLAFWRMNKKTEQNSGRFIAFGTNHSSQKPDWIYECAQNTDTLNHPLILWRKTHRAEKNMQAWPHADNVTTPAIIQISVCISILSTACKYYIYNTSDLFFLNVYAWGIYIFDVILWYAYIKSNSKVLCRYNLLMSLKIFFLLIRTLY